MIFDNVGSHSTITKAMKGFVEIIATETMKSDVSFVLKLFEEEETPIYDASSFERKDNSNSSCSDSELAGDQGQHDDSI